MKALAFALGLTIATSGGFALAASHEHDMSQHRMAAQPATQQGVGILKAVNAKDGKVQIAHEPIPALDWPAMTMWFTMEHPLPDGIAPGAPVRFDMIQGDKGQWKIMRIAPRK